MERRGMNERIKKLREQSVSIDPRIYMERADLMTDAYLEHEGSVSIPEMRALAFKHFMENKTLCINDGELIVGEKGDTSSTSPFSSIASVTKLPRIIFTPSIFFKSSFSE